MDYKAYGLHNFKQIPQISRLTEEQLFDIEVVGNVLPFRVNNYVIDELINWDDVPNDPIFILTFPQRDMLRPQDFDTVAKLLRQGVDKKTLRAGVDKVRLGLNPHPAGQLEHNVPMLGEESLSGMQHKYRETVLFFPSQGQTCHSYCSFCFRWPQFTGMSEFKFASREIDSLIAYLQEHPEVTDVLFTGGDPMIMKASNLAGYIEPLLEADIPNLKRIRIGTKSLGFWPHKFLTDADAEDTLALFRKVTDAGKHLAFMAHFSHWRELDSQPVREAIRKIQSTGAVIRTQSPLLRHINDDAEVWAKMWDMQVNLGCIPYYMFIARDTGAQDYFSVPLVKAWEIFQDAFQSVSGLARTVRGPSMSADPGKVQVLGVTQRDGKPVMELRFLQGRNPGWTDRTFFAAYDDKATWLDELRPAFGQKKFFFETELENFYRENQPKLKIVSSQ